MDNDYDPLNPDKEQQLFERISMDEDDLKALEFIRSHMRHIRKEEMKDKEDDAQS